MSKSEPVPTEKRRRGRKPGSKTVLSFMTPEERRAFALSGAAAVNAGLTPEQISARYKAIRAQVGKKKKASA